MNKRTMQCRILLLATLLIGVGVQAQTLSAADKERALRYLESTKQGVTDATKGLTPEQWNFKAGIAAHSDRHTKQILEVKADSKFPKS
jgi:hypothetical protein